MGVAIVAALAAAVLGVLVGPAGLRPSSVLAEIVGRLPFVDIDSGLNPREADIVWQLRLPRVVLGGIVGALLAVAGASYQGVFRNPLADPYLLGVAAGAGLGATLVIVSAGSSSAWLPLAAFAGGCGAVIAAYALGSAAGGRRTGLTLILSGVAVASFLTAIQTFVQQRHAESLREVYSWILGRLATAGWGQVRVILPYAVVAVVAILLHRRLLDVLAVGEDEARALGANPERIRTTIVVAATLGTAAAVSVSGLIGFVGIVVPHAIRLVVGVSYRAILPLAAIVGAGFLVLADVVARTALGGAEVPIGVVTAFVGGPFFIIVLRTARRGVV